MLEPPLAPVVGGGSLRLPLDIRNGLWLDNDMSSDTSTATRFDFIVGQTYAADRNSDHPFSFTVVSRTAKFITLEDRHGDTIRVGTYRFTFGGVDAEHATPFGRYSMSPVMSADVIG